MGAVAKRFLWKDHDNNFHDPKKMPTRHLFYTFRMIWNHTMPLDAIIPNCNIYTYFSPFYTADYMREAVWHIGAELATRGDLQPFMKTQLDFMRNYMFKHEDKLFGHLKLKGEVHEHSE